MYSRISVVNYRGFDSYRVDDLKRVNLVVGRNNSGKTAVLEAVQLVVAAEVAVTGSGEPDAGRRVLFDALWNIASARGEVAEMDGVPRAEAVELSHFFKGHTAPIGITATINAEPGVSLGFEVRPPSDEAMRQLELWEREVGSRLPGRSLEGVVIDRSVALSLNGIDRAVVPMDDGGTLVVPDYYRWRRSSPKGAGARLLRPESLFPSQLASSWDRLVKSKRESEVIVSLQVLMPEIEDLQFTTDSRERSRSGVLVSLFGENQRVPLGSLGDGVRRFLALSVSLTEVAGGVLLIDEIDTGLHYSVQADMWKLVVETARKSSVQVFATTHSLDCIRGLAHFIANDALGGDDIALHRIDEKLDHSVAFTGREVEIAAAHEVEVRG